MNDNSKTKEQLIRELEDLRRKIAELETSETERKRAEEALLECQEEFTAILETVPLAIQQISGKVNPTMIKLFGYTPEDIPTTEHWWPLAYPDETYRGQISEEWTKRITRAIETQSPIEPLETVVICKDGSKRNMSWDYITLGDKTYSCGLDLTERKRAEETLRESEERFRYVLENMKDAVWASDLSGQFEFLNPIMAHIYGRPLAEMKANPTFWIEAAHPEDQATARASHEALLGDGHVELEYRIVLPDGTVKWIFDRKTLLRDKNGELSRMSGIISDITERKQAEEQLLESEDKFRLAFQANPDAININRLEDGLYVDINQGFTDQIGYKREDVIGRTSLELNIWHDPADRERLVQGLRERGVYNNLEAQFHKKDGSLTTGLMSARVLMVGKVPHIISITRDITERKRVEEERAKLESQLQQAQKMESVGRLAGGVAHDFNNMLGAILGHAELALLQVDPAQPLQAHLEEIQKAARRSADLTRQLLAFARKQTVTPEVLDLNETVKSMIKMLKRLIGEDIDLAWQPEADLWLVKMDPSQIDQILANLCVNARDAIIDVGKVTLETGNITFDEAYCADHAGFVPGEYVLLAVSDNGCGMDQETLANIFEPFFTTKGVGQGTGLGLSTVYGAVKQNNGFINTYSEPGSGTTFKIYLPRHGGKTAQVQPKSLAEPVLRGQETILLVEDESAILNMTTIMLERQGYTVLAAITPGQAIHLAEAHPGVIHLVMTDVIMPEMNGRDLAKNLLSLYPHLKRLFMSGYTANVIAHHGVLDPGVHFIQKPFSIQRLAAKVREALDSK